MAPAVLAAGVMFSCTSNELEKVLEFTDFDSPPARSTLNVAYTFTDSGKVKNILKAGKLDQYQTADSAYSKISRGFELIFYDANSKFDGRLTAKNGYINGDNSVMIARDSVVFENKNKETLHTEELTWYEDSAKVYTNKFVTIERADGVIYGKGLTSNQNFTNYTIKEPTGVIYIKDDTE